MNASDFPIAHGWPDSPLEEQFMWAAEKYLGPAVRFELQVPLATEHGDFRVDVRFAEGSGRRVAVELDGAQFHEDYWIDLLRDAALLKAGHIAAVYRIRGRDLYRHPGATLWLLAQMEPWIFGTRGGDALSRHVRSGSHAEYDAQCARLHVSIPEDDDEGVDAPPRWDFLTITRHWSLSKDIDVANDWLRSWPGSHISTIRPRIPQ